MPETTVYEKLERQVASWCQAQSDITAAIVIGSRGRTSPTADEFSDLDLILFSQDRDRYTSDSAWLGELGKVWIAVLNYVGRGDPEWLVLFADGLKADFLFVAGRPGQKLVQMLDLLPYQDVLDRGVRILFERGQDYEVPPVREARATRPFAPSAQEFEQTVNNTLFAAERTAKSIHRGDVWRSLSMSGGDLSRHLLTLIEWHARSAQDSELDTWYDGRYMAQWADRRVLETLKTLNMGYSPKEQSAALLAALELIEWLAGETASNLEYVFPAPGQQKALSWLRQVSQSVQD